ncbi:helix-turn-helix domain-containing protein [Bacillus toyonensis]|uniref:helix-turn-helix domain-containing protein n=1 Tax=Bacillus toyonensis TaxID=155322 RepID=UPI000BFD1D43|nr:helix-turn-helix transcriptional regulator [Bacillus toyonensis]PHG59742.1 transcriptional regulator [Bacillus toyonensis]
MYVRIKEIRKKFGDTLQSLAEKIEYDYSNLSKVERGIYAPSLELLYKIATIYEISISDLLIDPTDNTVHDLEETPLSLDGQQISKEELEFLTQSIRIFRQTINQHKNKN